MRLGKLILGAASSLVIFAGAAQAGSCGYEYCWGALGVAGNGAYGWSYGQGSESDAINVAQRGCKGQCSVIKTFYNTCGAISVGDGFGWGWAWDNDQEIAKSISMSYCMDNAYNCAPRVWACSK